MRGDGIHVGRSKGDRLVFIGISKKLTDTAVSPLTKQRLVVFPRLEDDVVRWLIAALRKELRNRKATK